jgi:hypothetical protein
MSVIEATQEAEIRRITVLDHPYAKNYQYPISVNKSGVVVHTCHPSYAGGLDMRMPAKSETRLEQKPQDPT